MSKERELLIGALEWMQELKYVYADARDSGDRVLLELIADINKIEVVLSKPKRDLDEQRLPHAEMTEYEKGFADALDEAINIKLQRPKPIEEGELEVWYSQHTWAMDKQEYMWGFRDAEKAHGIGVDNE
jgi:hypothetical protein